MRSLSTKDILIAWESGTSERPSQRALTLLALACPDMDHQDLAALTIGQRDALLLDLREKTFGRRIDGFADCPRCEERLELSLSTKEIRTEQGNVPMSGNETKEFMHDGVTIRFRLPDSTDLRAIEECDPGEAHDLIVQRCLVETAGCDMLSNGGEHTSRLVTELAQRIAQADPLAEVLLYLRCPACDNRWQATLDIAAFLWEELVTYARALMRDVHTLATAYGWPEADILSLSPARRQFYLDMVAQ